MKLQSKNQHIDLPVLKEKGVTLAIKREDAIHPFISGNKYRKLKYNLAEAQDMGSTTLLTFGGAYSNHIAATAFAGKEKGFKTIGIIRGEELQEKWKQNPTLLFAYENGMSFKFISRAEYSKKNASTFLKDLQEEFDDFYLIPEGGTNPLAIKGCEEILTDMDSEFNTICTCVGTGGTIAGLINSCSTKQQVLGFSALKGDFLNTEIKEMTLNNNWSLQNDYHFDGYGKVTRELVAFINDFKKSTGVPLDPIYTGKMLYGLLHMIKNDSFAPGTKILAIHTGGLQGIEGMNRVLKKKNLPLLCI